MRLTLAPIFALLVVATVSQAAPVHDTSPARRDAAVAAEQHHNERQVFRTNLKEIEAQIYRYHDQINILTDKLARYRRGSAQYNKILKEIKALKTEADKLQKLLEAYRALDQELANRL